MQAKKQQTELMLTHAVPIIVTKHGLRIGQNLLTWGFIEDAKQGVLNPQNQLKERLAAPDERTICPDFGKVSGYYDKPEVPADTHEVPADTAVVADTGASEEDVEPFKKSA